MRQQKLFFWLRLISLLLMICHVFLFIQISIAQEREDLVQDILVDINIGRIVAADYLPTYYPDKWAYFHNLIFYDLDGRPAAYAFIFSKANYAITTLQELEDAMSKALSEQDKIITG